jgi:hypothetical protein
VRFESQPPPVDPPVAIARPQNKLIGRRRTPHPSQNKNPDLKSFDGQPVDQKMLFGRPAPTQHRQANSPTDTVVEDLQRPTSPRWHPAMSPQKKSFMRTAEDSPQSPTRFSPTRAKGSKRKARETSSIPAIQLGDWDEEDDEEVVLSVKKTKVTPKSSRLKPPANKNKKPASQPVRESPGKAATKRTRKPVASKQELSQMAVTPKGLSKMTVPALRNMLKELGATNVFGSRSDLVERIKELSR